MEDEPVYHAGMRELQDLRDTRRLADRLAEVTMHSTFTDEDRAFIQRCRMFCIATADEHGSPDCSYKGGRAGIRAMCWTSNTLAMPDYDGNGMYRTWGNVLVNPHVGLLFLDFETPKRMRVNGTAQVSRMIRALCATVPGGRVRGIGHRASGSFPTARATCIACSWWRSPCMPRDPQYTPPVPAWKTFEEFRDALPERDRKPGPT